MKNKFGQVLIGNSNNDSVKSEDVKYKFVNKKEYDDKNKDEFYEILKNKKGLRKNELGYILMELNYLEEAYQYVVMIFHIFLRRIRLYRQVIEKVVMVIGIHMMIVVVIIEVKVQMVRVVDAVQ